MLSKTLLARALQGAKAKQELKARNAALKREADRHQEWELQRRRQRVAQVRQQQATGAEVRREALLAHSQGRGDTTMLARTIAVKKQQRRQRHSNKGSTGSLAHTAPSSMMQSRSRHTVSMPQLALPNSSRSSSNNNNSNQYRSSRRMQSRRPGSASAVALLAVPESPHGYHTPTNVWGAVDARVAAEERRDKKLARQRQLELAKDWQATLARQLKEAEDRAREQREYDARYAQAEKQQMQQRDLADREKKERRRAKNAREAAARARQVQSARRRHMQHLEQERKRAAAEKARFEYEEAEAEAERVQRILDNKAQLDATVADNQTRLAAAAQQRQQQIQNDKVLTAQWRRIMDAQEKRRMMDVNKIKALQAKAERFAATMPDNRAQLRREEELAKQWRRTKWDAEDEKQRRKAEAKKALVLQQQRGLDAQSKHLTMLRKQAQAEEMALAGRLTSMDQQAVREDLTAQQRKRQANIEYQKEVLAQRAYDRRQKQLHRLAGTMDARELTYNARLVTKAMKTHAGNAKHSRTGTNVFRETAAFTLGQR